MRNIPWAQSGTPFVQNCTEVASARWLAVDSGATCTYVWVVVDGRVDAARTQTQNVGGWHVAEFLKNALAWRGNKEADGATVSSLDTLSVKQKCRLSLNIAREDQRPSSGASKMETLHIKSQRDAARLSKLEPTEVTLSSELFLAPEMMYASLDLPAMVQEATRDLPDYLIKDCFSRILLTGEYSISQVTCQVISTFNRLHSL